MDGPSSNFCKSIENSHKTHRYGEIVCPLVAPPANPFIPDTAFVVTLFLGRAIRESQMLSPCADEVR